jgi:hypothetical protein
MLGSKKFSPSSGQPVLLVGDEKVIQNYVPVSTLTPTQGYANARPFKPKELILNPNDQRSWSYYKFFVQIPDYVNQDSSLNPPMVTASTADQIWWGNEKYKIITTEDWQKTNGLVKYECIKDFQNTPDIRTPPTSWINGIALCDIISQMFQTQGTPLDNGQIFLMNSNYTPPSTTDFLIVIQLLKIEATGFGGIPTEKTSPTSATETVVQTTQETYSIEVVSADGSAEEAISVVSLALVSERDYAQKKQYEVGFNIASVSDASNISNTTGGSTCTRWRINVRLLSSRSRQITGIETYSTTNLSLWFNQG